MILPKRNLLLFLCCIPFLFAFLPSDPPKYRPGKDYALFIAVSDYVSWRDLRNPIRDVEAVARELKDRYGFDTLILRNPTQAAIYSKLREFSGRKYAEDGQLFIFFSGHGYYDEQTTEGFFIPRDGKPSSQDPDGTSWVAHARLNDRIAAIPCRHILLVIDACFSGTFDRRIAVSRNEEQVKAYVNRGLQYKSRLYLTSGGKEYVSDGQEHSPFTRGLLSGLRLDENGLVSFPELVAKLDYIQPKPRYGEFEGSEAGGNFFFISKGAFIPGTSEAFRRPTPSRSEDANYVYDPDGNRYRKIRLAGLTWTQENLNYPIPGSSWYHDGLKSSSEKKKYGRLYTWKAAKEACAALGNGWHLPTYEEWDALRNNYGGSEKAYNAHIKDGSSGFTALLGGCRYTFGICQYLGHGGYYWSATEIGFGLAWYYLFFRSYGKLNHKHHNKAFGFSCRCVKG